VLFATTTLAGRIERAESDTVTAFGRRAAEAGADLLVHPIGGTAAVYGGPGQPFNKVAGLGFAPLEESAVADLEAIYDARSAEIRVEQSSLADPAVAAMLVRRGYTLAGYENVLGLALTPALVSAWAREGESARGAGIEIAPADDVAVWIRTATQGFLHPDVFDGPPPTESFGADAMEQIFRDFSGAEGFVLSLARLHGEIAGSGALRIVDGLAQLAGASTLPAHRRRGVQSALLRARLVAAAAAGCDLAVVTTEPGSRSQMNVQRAGFALLYVRAILIRRAASAERGAADRAAVDEVVETPARERADHRRG
jgi:ribosomal protein S18 acetylase RimI-like enzyme